MIDVQQRCYEEVVRLMSKSKYLHKKTMVQMAGMWMILSEKERGMLMRNLLKIQRAAQQDEPRDWTQLKNTNLK